MTEKAISKPKIFFCSELSRIFIAINKAKEFLKSEIEIYRQKYKPNTQKPAINPNLFWYRGERNAMNNLIPSLYRRVIDVEKTDSDWSALRKYEKDSVSEFKTRAYHLVPNINAYNDYMVISLMQHHGVDTRALDFSESLLSSLFFALEKYIQNPNCESDSLPCIWLFKPDSFYFTMEEECTNEIQYLDQMGDENKDSDNKLPVNPFYQLTKAPYIADRIRVQQGCFAFFPNQIIETLPKGFKGLALNLLPNSRCFLVCIALTQPREIAKEVVRVGLKKSFIYPELMSVCEEVKKYTFPEL